MKKGELLKLLEPYSDDIEIEVLDYMEGVSAGTVEKVYINEDGELRLHCNWKDNIKGE